MDNPHLAKFMRNNDTPPDAILTEVKDLISKPLEDLEKKKKEIESIIKALDDLEDERDVIQASVTKYATILSPVRRIPTDVLHEIFYHCLPTHRNPIMSFTEPPLLLTRICQSWRSIALSYHYIWSKLHVPLIPYSISTYDPWPTWPPIPGVDAAADLEQKQREQAEKYAKTMQARSKFSEIWLSRSGSCPLSISLKFFEGFGQILPGDLGEGNPLFQLFTTILSFSERLNTLELTIPFEIYQMLQDMASLDMMTNLQNLRANFFQGIAPDPQATATMSPVILLQAPNLQSLSIFNTNVGVAIFDYQNIPSTWANFTHLFFHSPITSAEAVQVLRTCQNLDHCKLVISDGLDVYLAPQDVLSLPHLRFLCIQVSGRDTMAVIYRRIIAPRLNSFQYQGYHRLSPDYSHHTLHSSPVIPLLEKSSSIRKLSFDPRLLTAQDILFAFRFANQLTHLVLGRRSRVHRSIYDHAPGLRTGGNFDLNLLIIDEESDVAPPYSGSGKDILLPKLEVFEAYLTSNITDETLRQFILSRLGDPERKGVSSLKTVKVAFERSRKDDICEEVYRRAQEAGVEIVLDLSYYSDPFPHASKYTDALSPWYGLSDPSYGESGGDRSWNFSDDEMESF